MEQQQKPKKKKWISTLLFATVNIGIIVYMAVKEFGSGARDAGDVSQLRLNLWYLLAALGCFLAALAAETMKYRFMMRTAAGRKDTVCAFECAVYGKYYDNITPLGAGGQPFQVFYLKKQGLPTGASAALPIAGFLSLQLAFSLVAVLVFCFCGEVVNGIPVVRYSAYVGLAFYLFLPACILLFTAAPGPFGRFLAWGIRVLHKLHLIKDAEKSTQSTLSSLQDYRESLKLLSSRPMMLSGIFLFSVLYQVAILSIPYFVLMAFGSEVTWLNVFALVTFIYAAITFIPTPGNAGAAEGSFYTVFSSLKAGHLFWAVLIWRLLCYYSWLLLGFGLYTGTFFKKKGK